MFEWLGFTAFGCAIAYAEWSRPPHTGSVISGFIGVGALFGTLYYLLGSTATLSDIAGLWLVTAAGFAGGFLRDRFKGAGPS